MSIALGFTEAAVQKYGLGENQILVELPGLEDPTRVEEVIKSTAKLEIHAVVGGPYDDVATAMQANNGVIPFDSVLMQGVASAGAPVRSYLLKRASEVGGDRLPRCSTFAGYEWQAEYYLHSDVRCR